MKRKGQQFTGVRLFEYQTDNYHVADTRGRLYLCGCFWGHKHVGMRSRGLTHKRNNELFLADRVDDILEWRKYG